MDRVGDRVAVERAGRQAAFQLGPDGVAAFAALGPKDRARYMRAVRRAGLSREDHFAVLRLLSEPRAAGLADHELLDVARLAPRPRGSRLPSLAARLFEQARRPRVALGFPELDARAPVPLGGLVVIIGPEGSGKSAMGLQMAGHHASAEGPVVILSIELSAEEVAARRVSQVVDVSWDEALRGQVDARFVDDALALPRLSLLDGELATLDHAIAELRALKVEFPDQPAMLVVDYVQILAADGREERERMKNAIEALRRIAKAEDCVVVVISQTSRAARALLRKGDLSGADAAVAGAESSQIERAGYVVLALGSMADMESGEVAVDVSIAKNRLGRGDLVIPMAFDGRRGRFRELGPAVPAGKRKEERSTRTDAKRATTAEHAVENLIARSKAPMHGAEVYATLGGKKTDVLAALRSLVDDGRIVRVAGPGVVRKGGVWPVWTPDQAAAAGLRPVTDGGVS
jgi:KaiC/GvpD/RAD55 family RecA-like ATPase